MGKKQKKKQKMETVETIASELSTQCTISAEPSGTPPGKATLTEQINPELLSKWPKVRNKVPPVFLHNPIDILLHLKKMINSGINYYAPCFGNNYTRIIGQTMNDHKLLVQYFDKKQLPYHTFGNPAKRKMKIVIRGLPVGSNLNTIKQELKSASIPVIRVHEMQTKVERRDKTMLVLAVVPYDDEGKAILKVTQLLGHDVKLEPPKDKMKQCYRCQKWGHSQRYCHGQIKCVKCGGEHLSKKCEKSPDQEPKCANCGEAHTASYRKCSYVVGADKKQIIQIAPSSPREVISLDTAIFLQRVIAT